MVVSRMATRRERTHQILDIHTAARYQTQSVGQDREAPLDHRTGLRGVEARVGARPFRRSQLARVSPPRHTMHCGLWVPGSRAEPFFPLCPSRSFWIRCPQARARLPATRVAASGPSDITRIPSPAFAFIWRACCCGNCLTAHFADRLRVEHRYRNLLHRCRFVFWHAARLPSTGAQLYTAESLHGQAAPDTATFWRQ